MKKFRLPRKVKKQYKKSSLLFGWAKFNKWLDYNQEDYDYYKYYSKNR